MRGCVLIELNISTTPYKKARARLQRYRAVWITARPSKADTTLFTKHQKYDQATKPFCRRFLPRNLKLKRHVSDQLPPAAEGINKKHTS